MVDTNMKGSVAGKSATREYSFQAVEGAQYVSLPQADIDALDLKPSMFAPAGPTGDDGNLTIGKRYQAGVNFADCYIDLDVVPAKEPTIGADALRALGYEVDLEQGIISQPAEPVKIYRGLMPTMLDVSQLGSAN